MRAVSLGVDLDRLRKTEKVRDAALLVAHERLVYHAYPVCAAGMVLCGDVQQCIGLVRALPQTAEQVAILLRVMQSLGEQVDVLQQRVENPWVRRRLAGPDPVDKKTERVQYSLDRAVLRPDGSQRG